MFNLFQPKIPKMPLLFTAEQKLQLFVCNFNSPLAIQIRAFIELPSSAAKSPGRYSFPMNS